MKQETSEHRTHTINRNHKDRLFRRLFDGSENKENLLSLYNAVNNTDYTDVSALEITTLEDAIYLGMKNDVSFVIESTMNIYEHQSTFCPNMPLRGLDYAARLYGQYVEVNNVHVYGKRKIGIPIPKYVVFYNGEDAMPDSMKLKLSDMFEPAGKDTEGEFEWTATMLNVNAGHNKELMERCKPLYEYAEFIGKIRQYNKQLPLSEAIDRAVDECIKGGILEMLLTKHRSEVKDFILMDYDEQKTMNAFYEDGCKDGIERGRMEGIDIGTTYGRAEGRAEGIQVLIEDNLEEGISLERITEKLKNKFKLTQEQAENYLDKYSK